MEENNQNQYLEEFENPKPQRPFALSFFCVLSFINAAFQVLSGMVVFLMFDVFKNIFGSEEYIEMMENAGIDIEAAGNPFDAAFSVRRIYYFLSALLYVFSFIGALDMWKLQKKGFHIYTIAQILILIITAIFVVNVTGASIWGDVIYTAIFVIFYYLHYKKVMQ